MKNKIKSLLNKMDRNSIYLGLKKGIMMEILPKKVQYVLDLAIMRIFRVIGGLCVLMVLLIRYGLISIELPYIVYIFISFLALLQLIQIVIISLIKIVYGLNKLFKHREDFEVRNSPLNRLATVTANLAYCWKVGCQVGSSGVGLLGASVLIDGVLVDVMLEECETIIDKIGNITLSELYNNFKNISEKININSNYKEIGFNLVSYGILVRTFNKLVINRPIPKSISNEELQVIKTTKNFSRFLFAGLVTPLLLFSFHQIRRKESLFNVNVNVNFPNVNSDNDSNSTQNSWFGLLCLLKK